MGIRLLVIDDNQNDIALIEYQLSRYFREAVVVHGVCTKESMQEALEQTDGWDAVICDYALPGFEWPGALRLARQYSRELVFIVISGVVDDDKGMAAIRDGANDYISKNNLSSLGPTLEKCLRMRAVYRTNSSAVNQLLAKLESVVPPKQ